MLGEGFHAALGEAHAEREALAACGDADTRGATLYVSLEPCCHQGNTPPCTDAIVDAGIRRVVVASDDPTEKAAGRGLGILRDEGIEVAFADGELAARARLLNQPFRKHARTGHPVGAVQVGDDARRQGRDPHRRLQVDLRRGLAPARAPLARASATPSPCGIGTALADDPQLTARIDGVHRQPRRVVFDSEARLPLDSQLVRGADDVPLTVVVSRAAPRLADRRARGRRRRGRRRHGRERARPRAHRARPARRARASARSCSRAARTWRARSSTPARSTRCACSWRRSCSAARAARDPLEGDGRRAHRRGHARAHARVRAGGRRRPDHRAPEGVVSRVHGAGRRTWGRSPPSTPTADGVRLAVRTRARRRAQRGRLGGRQRRLPDRHRDRGRRASRADVMNETLRRSSLAEVGRRLAGQPRAAAARRRPARRPRRAGPRRRRRHRARRRARTASPASSTIAAPPELLRYVVEKGSIAVDGISLTVVGDRTTTRSPCP